MNNPQREGHVVDTLVRNVGVSLESRHAMRLRHRIDEMFQRERRAGTLHHYLDARALQGFLSGGIETRPRLWASLATHLNDYEEVIHGQRLILKAFKRFCDEHQEAADFLRRFQGDRPGSWQDELSPEVPWTNIFVTCFTELEDSLTMWRGYADERGYAMTFEVSDWPRDILLVPVQYEERVDDLDVLFGALLDFYLDLREDQGPVDDRAMFKTMKDALGLAAAVYKKPEWHEEREWRLVQWCEPKLSSGGEKHIQFRDRKGRLIPYHEITLPEEFRIQKITFGPGYHQGTEKRALELIVDAYLPGRKIDIVPTNVPLRRD